MATAPNPAEPVRIYAEDDARLPLTVARTLKEYRDGLILGLSEGSAKDFAEYREKVGEIRALATAINICQDAGNQLSKR